MKGGLGTVIITGASGGIGSALCRRLDGKVEQLILLGRDQARLEQQAAGLAQSQATCYAADLADPAAVKGVFQSIFKQHQRLDGVVHCVGQLQEQPLLLTRPEQLQQQFAVNSFSAFYLIQYAARLMARRQRGSIVLMSSQVAAQGSPGQAVYGASKAALEGMARSLAKELAASGIRLNAVAPGFIETDLVAHYDDSQRQQLAEQTALGRLGKADDVAALAAFLLTDEAAYITGQTLAVDGGLRL